jgi:hypothetical protein
MLAPKVVAGTGSRNPRLDPGIEVFREERRF